jgi:glucokinase
VQNQRTDGLLIGVDIGGTKIAAGLVDSANGDVIYSVKAVTPKDGNESILDSMGGLIEQLLNEAPDRVTGIGVGIPGFVDRDKGIALAASNVNYLNMPVAQYIRERFNRSAYLENDTNAGTLGEKWFGSGKGLLHFVYLAIGTGIGGGLIFNGKLYLGRGNAGEIGHMIVEPDGELCVCGTPGCLEALASGSSIAKHAIAKLKEGGYSSMCDNLAMEKIITSEGVVNAARAGDRLALEVMADVGKALALNLVSLVRLLDPEAIIIGGGVSQAKDLLSDAILSAMPNERFMQHIKEILRFSTWSSGIVGAASVVLENEKG